MDAEEWIESIVRALMFLAGVLGNNWLAIRSLPGHKSSIRTNEVLFINLAISNLITNYLVDLPDTMADFEDRWFLGETYCGVFRFCSDLSETSSIYSTFFISVFWYQKLVGSLKRGGAPVQLDSLRLIACLLAGSWMLAIAFSIPHFFFVTVEATNDSHEDCIDVFPNAVARQTYDILYLTLANAVPIAGIVYSSIQIVITLLQNKRRINGHKSDNTKDTGKDNSKGPGNKTENSLSTVDGPGASPDYRASPSLTNIHTGVPSLSCSDEGPPGHTSSSAPLCAEASTENRAGAPSSLSRPSQPPAKPTQSSSTQVRAAKSVVAVASVFLVCWLSHLLLRITNNIHTSSLIVEVASYVAASYTCIIPYIFLHGVKKLSCSCRR
ncbi:melanopsin [Myripristis murdjan]|uniref:melanopsin n=1 Tax=Myripristis murdjan TaxID=586833 RepID=UPI001175CFD1|nr:melanopsin-like [Myripristis murdjan]